MSRRLNIDESYMFAKERHPDFDAAWEEHSGLVYWWSARVARIFNRTLGARAWEREDFLGLMTVRLNYILYHWKPELGTITTVFSQHAIGLALRFVVWIDRENWRLDKEAHDELLKAYAYHKNRDHMYRPPQNESWAEQLLDVIPDDDKWAYLTRTMKERTKTIMEWVYRDGMNFAEVGKLLEISRERVRQVHDAALGSLRGRIERLEPVRKLFYGE